MSGLGSIGTGLGSIPTASEGAGAGGGGSGSGGFGPDTIIFQKNAANAFVRTLELVNTLTISAPGAEESILDILLLHGGAQVTAQHITGLGTLFPAGLFDGVPANTVCSVGFKEKGTGFRWMTPGGGFSAIGIDISGDEIGTLDFRTALGFDGGRMRLLGTTPSYVVGDRWTIGNVFNGVNLNLQILQSGGQTNDIVLGSNTARTGAENVGYSQVQAYAAAGKPTGTPTIATGHFALTYNTTTKKIEVYDAINAVWLETAALT
jgi:hypothetical protein